MSLEADLAQRVAKLEVEIRRRPEITRRSLAIYTTTAAQSIPDNTTPFTTINFATIEYDPLGLVTPGVNWVWTAPWAGVAEVSTAIMFASTAGWVAGEAGEIDLYKNGVKYSVLDRKDNYGATASFMQLGGPTRALVVAAGDTLAVRAFQNSGAALTLFSPTTGFNWICIKLTG